LRLLEVPLSTDDVSKDILQGGSTGYESALFKIIKRGLTDPDNEKGSPKTNRFVDELLPDCDEDEE
jgi:hypothetical protein